MRLLMLTGARRQELGSLTWSEINFAARVINLPASRVKNKKPHQIPLSQIAFDILAARQQDFPNHGDTDADAGHASRDRSSERRAVGTIRAGPLRASWACISITTRTRQALDKWATHLSTIVGLAKAAAAA